MWVIEGEVLHYCERCDRESKYLINFLSPDDVPELVCQECVGQQAQRSTRFSPPCAGRQRAVSRVY